jgi:uncharacterized protein with PIN domain
MKRRVIASGAVKALLIDGDGLGPQLRQVVETYELDVKGGFSRCIGCNVSLVDAAKGEVRERVPPFVFETQEEFMECPACAKLYWRGTHWHNMRLELVRMKGEST